MAKELDLSELKTAARDFIALQSQTAVASLYGVTDGKAVGTYVEQAFRTYLTARYTYRPGNAALGIDFPELGVDLKVTSVRQPQSSSPFASASQKVYGLGYHLLVFMKRSAWIPAPSGVGGNVASEVHNRRFALRPLR